MKHAPLPWKQACFQITDASGGKVCHTGMGQRPPAESHVSERNAEYIARATTNLPLVIAAARRLIATNPVFRLRPVGGENSAARLQQQDGIEAEDDLIKAIEQAEREGAEP